MSTKFKITYEHKSGDETHSEEVFLHSEGEPSQSEVHEAVLQDTARFNRPGAGVAGVADFTVISVVPDP
ncbi:hypothetical protein AAH450_18735 [Erwinia sp. P7711]|uniref:hypothetical protein n=1 Tax=unclassified Erwinia TaxID=2622719 RepID=UPI0029906F6E|nr:hypothetical protein [Erwinia sp. MMLR14_017]MDW8847661.1 hypothetical protein [Erwinia sp. MMLR14_017]